MGDQTKALRFLAVSSVVIGVLAANPPVAEANVISGLTKIVAGVLNMPLSVLAGTMSGPPLVGTLLGAVNGTLQGIGMVAGGALELAMDGVALAKMAAPFVLPFVL